MNRQRGYDGKPKPATAVGRYIATLSTQPGGQASRLIGSSGARGTAPSRRPVSASTTRAAAPHGVIEGGSQGGGGAGLGRSIGRPASAGLARGLERPSSASTRQRGFATQQSVLDQRAHQQATEVRWGAKGSSVGRAG